MIPERVGAVLSSVRNDANESARDSPSLRTSVTRTPGALLKTNL